MEPFAVQARQEVFLDRYFHLKALTRIAQLMKLDRHRNENQRGQSRERDEAKR